VKLAPFYPGADSSPIICKRGGTKGATMPPLYHEIRQKGYTGKRSMVARFVRAGEQQGYRKPRRLRNGLHPNTQQYSQPALRISSRTNSRSCSTNIANQCPDAVPLRQFSIDFRDALSSSEAWRMEGWIELVKRCQFGALVRFAYGLQKDIEAVNAAVDTSWSTDQVEGQINRLKMIKRQGMGVPVSTCCELAFCPTHLPSPSPADPRRRLAPKVRKIPFLVSTEVKRVHGSEIRDAAKCVDNRT
jgi:transposase